MAIFNSHVDSPGGTISLIFMYGWGPALPTGSRFAAPWRCDFLVSSLARSRSVGFLSIWLKHVETKLTELNGGFVRFSGKGMKTSQPLHVIPGPHVTDANARIFHGPGIPLAKDGT